MLNNLRSALDHTVTAIDPRAGRRAAFPICTSSADFTRWAEQWTGNWQGDEGWIDLFRHHQPFRAPEVGSDPESIRIRILAKLNNADKHRKLTLLANGFATLDGAEVSIHPGPGAEVAEVKWIHPPNVIKEGAVLFRFRVNPPQAHDASVAAAARVLMGVSIDGFPSVVELMGDILSSVASICNDFRLTSLGHA